MIVFFAGKTSTSFLCCNSLYGISGYARSEWIRIIGSRFTCCFTAALAGVVFMLTLSAIKLYKVQWDILWWAMVVLFHNVKPLSVIGSNTAGVCRMDPFAKITFCCLFITGSLNQKATQLFRLFYLQFEEAI